MNAQLWNLIVAIVLGLVGALLCLCLSRYDYTSDDYRPTMAKLRSWFVRGVIVSLIVGEVVLLIRYIWQYISQSVDASDSVPFILFLGALSFPLSLMSRAREAGQ